MTDGQGAQVIEIGDADRMRSEIDRETGSLICWRDFDVTRPGKTAHRVSVEIGESNMPQADRCDCSGYKYRGECSHVAAVYDSGQLDGPVDY